MMNVKYDLPKFVVITVMFIGAVIYFIATNKSLTVIDIVTLSVLLLLMIIYFVGKRRPKAENETVE